MTVKTITLQVDTPDGEWPVCFYGRYDDHGQLLADPPLCGERHAKSVHPDWTNLCDCPSCPLKCAIRGKVWKERKR